MILLKIAISVPYVRKAPGAIIIISVLGNASGSIVTPKSVPAPRNSRTRPMKQRAIVNPRPLPIPSQNETIGPFFEANASARPRIIPVSYTHLVVLLLIIPMAASSAIIPEIVEADVLPGIAIISRPTCLLYTSRCV